MKSIHPMTSKSKQLYKIWPISQLIHLSYLSQNMYIKHQALISTFTVVQTILEVAIPMISIIPITNSYLSNFQPLCRLFSYEFTEWLGNLSLVFIFFELILFLLCASLIICLLKSKNQTILKYSLNALIFLYMISALLLFMQTQEILQFITTPDSQITSLQSAQHTIISILSIINIILILSLTVIFNLVCHSYSTTILNHLCKKFCLKSCIIDLIYRIMLTFLPYLLNMLKNPSNKEFVTKMSIVYTSLYLAINIFKQYNQIRYFTYLSNSTGKIYRFCITFEFSLILITLICLISSQILIIENSVFVILSLWFFLYKTLYYYLANRDQYYQLLELKEITNPRDAEMYIWQLNKIFSENGDKQSLILSNIKKNHEQVCQDASCSCKQLTKGKQNNDELQNIQRQNTNVRIGNKRIKAQTSVETAMNYQRMLIIDILDKICDKYPEDMDVILLISYIKLKVYCVFGDTLWKLSRLSRNSGMSPSNIRCKEIYNKIFVEKFIINLRNMIITRNNQLQISQTEQCLESDELVEQMIRKYERIIQLKVQFWKFFSKGVVVHHYFQKAINDQIQVLKQFHKFNQYLIGKFKNSYLLVSLLIGYEKFVLFKQKISRDLSQIAKLSKLTHSHEKIFKIQKSKGQKQSIQRWILSSMCCTFEALINFQQLGTVVSTSKNIETVFGYKPQMVNGFNINKLMPTSMQEQHDYILNSWAKKCSWTNLGKIRNVFCIDRNNVSFSSGVYLKFIQRQSSINVIASIFKENDQDFMIIDHNGIIVGAGSRFFNLLGRVLVGLPLKFICTQSKNIKKWALQNNRIKHRTIFFSIKQHSQLLQKFLQNKYSIDGQIQQQIQSGFIKDQQTHGHILEMEVYPYHIGRIFFSVIKMSSIISENMALAYRNPTFKGSQANIFSYQQKQYYSKAEIKPESSITDAKISEQNIFACNSSVGSSNSSRQMSMQNNIDRFQDMFYQKQRIFDKRIIKIIVVVLILCGIGLGMSSYKISLNSKGFLEMQEILFADGACSDNLQLSMFVYNKALSINRKVQEYIRTKNERQYQKLKQEIQGEQYEQKQLHRLVVAQIQNMNKYMTSLSNIVLFKYQKQLVQWLDDVVEGVTTTRFMLNYVYLSNQVSLLSSNISKLIKSNTTKPQISSTKNILQINLQKMKINFPELQRLNKVNLDYYKNIFLQTQQKMLLVSYVKISITMMTVVVILSILQQHYYYRSKQVKGIYSEYKKFPEESVLALIRYFIDFKYYLKEKSRKRHDGILLERDLTTLTSSSHNSFQLQLQKDSESEKLQNNKSQRETERKYRQQGIRKLQDHREDIQLKLLKINTIFENCSADLLTKTQSTIKKATLTIHSKKISLSTITCILTIVVILSINIIMFKTEKGIMQTAQKIVSNINDLMDSQNIVISTYFSLKGAFTTAPILSKPQSQTLLYNLLQRINKTQATFNKIAAHSLYLFQLYDPSYPQKMITILTSNICDLLDESMPEQYYKKCVFDYQMRMLKYGIMNSMNFFTRKIIDNIYALIQITNNRTNSTSIIQASTISEVDKTLIYMFKIYQQTQAQITSSFIIAIDNLILQNMMIISVEYLFFLGVIIFVVVFYKTEEKNHINRIGRILLIPIKILQANRQMMRNFQKVIDYDDFK